ncbi:MAG TPA: hypothetical protein VEF36_06515 [Roseiarcus sp.]|nr:hypothetical protein [Roseiarcus sp.]
MSFARIATLLAVQSGLAALPAAGASTQAFGGLAAVGLRRDALDMPQADALRSPPL